MAAGELEINSNLISLLQEGVYKISQDQQTLGHSWVDEDCILSARKASGKPQFLLLENKNTPVAHLLASGL